MTSPNSWRVTEPQIRNRPRSKFANLETPRLIVFSTTSTSRVGFLPLSAVPLPRLQSAMYVRSYR